jgi:hypothetical protein
MINDEEIIPVPQRTSACIEGNKCLINQLRIESHIRRTKIGYSENNICLMVYHISHN